MTNKAFNDLEVGDIVYHVSDRNDTYIVMAHYGDHVAAVRYQDLSNPSEWELAAKITERALAPGTWAGSGGERTVILRDHCATDPKQ